MQKQDELQHGCMAKAAPDEPVFVLRAQDRLAPQMVREWAMRAKFHGLGPTKLKEALDLADAMERWPTRKFPD